MCIIAVLRGVLDTETVSLTLICPAETEEQQLHTLHSILGILCKLFRCDHSSNKYKLPQCLLALLAHGMAGCNMSYLVPHNSHQLSFIVKLCKYSPGKIDITPR